MLKYQRNIYYLHLELGRNRNHKYSEEGPKKRNIILNSVTLNKKEWERLTEVSMLD